MGLRIILTIFTNYGRILLLSLSRSAIQCLSLVFKLMVNMYISTALQDNVVLYVSVVTDGQNMRLTMLGKVVMKLIELIESAI